MTTSRIAGWLRRTAAAPALWMMFIPGLASAQQGAIQGTVKDVSGSAITGAIVTLENSTLENSTSAGQRTAITDQAGGFRFSTVTPGNYKITIAAAGFATWTDANVA